MKKLVSIFSLLVLWGALCYGQIENIRKLQKQLPFINDSLRYVDALNRLAMLSYENNVDSTFFYTEKARNIASRLRYAKGLADAANNLGIVYDMKGNLQLALRYYNNAYNRYQNIHDTANMVEAVMNIAMVYQELGRNQKAINEYKKAIATGSNLSRDSILSILYYNYLIQYRGSIPADSIPFYLNKAKGIATKYKDRRVLLAIEQLTADTYIKDNQHDKGITLLKQAASDAIKSKLYYMSLDILIELGDLYAPTDSATAVSYYKEGLNITEQKEYRVYNELISKKLYNFYASKNDIKQAFYYSRKLIELHEEQEKVDNASGVDFIEYALKDQQLESARVQSKYELWFLFLAVLVCMLTIIILLVLWRSWKQLRKTSGALRLQFDQSEDTMEALEVMNKNYARLIKVVAHDLRNPISAINSISDMLEPDEKLPADMKELMGLIRISSKNSIDLINDLLQTDFDQEQHFKMEVLNIDELLGECLSLLNFRAKDKNQQLILNAKAGVNIIGDREKLWRVINNLVVNAMKFSPEEGEIYVESTLSGNNVIIAVKDTGMGIPADIQSKVFDPFTTAKRNGTNGEQPFGLGLFISKQIVDAHKGKIWLESETEKGSVFYVELPALEK
ncbi:signal transduction histidine kinase [Mucilaginibacter frigoritolerans]|jgi:signal transduction histidine kinase|uniref:histidine kinase n=1 Tax=Mucilaginibacter frigoritolerans TaxID=652788 RepID=A0A562U6P8_9SPHI|nr:tetratricopeptide repeat-containing sensor histidine kinase [Mucilaginibacter frigoritolerans]TWJ01438.1 signal transduction histidine kinase [Mucilaginibacter frigoritolerans]